MHSAAHSQSSFAVLLSVFIFNVTLCIILRGVLEVQKHLASLEVEPARNR